MKKDNHDTPTLWHPLQNLELKETRCTYPTVQKPMVSTSGEANGSANGSPLHNTQNGDAESGPSGSHESEDEEAETPQLSVAMTIGLLVVVTVVSAIPIRKLDPAY